MLAKEAIVAAKGFLLDIFQDEKLSGVGLEEVQFDDESKMWKITLGFFRNWRPEDDVPHTNASAAMIEIIRVQRARDRFYKVVSIDDRSGRMVSLVNRELVS